MSLRKGLVRAGRTLDSPRKSLGGVVRTLTLDNPAGWLTGVGDISMSRDKAMKVSTVNRCVEVLSTSMAVLPVYIMNERTKERLPDHRLGRVLWGRANEAMTTFDYQRLMLCNQLLRGNAYAWINRDPNSGHPRELIPLPPDHVRPQVDPAGHTLNPLNPKMVDIKGVIPSSDGGFTIRELGVFDRAGTLIGVCNTPDMEKARPDSGAGGKLDVIMHLIVTDANALNIVVKPSLDTVSLEDVTGLLGGKQDKLEGWPGQVPVFNENGDLEAQDFSGSAVFAFTAEDWGPPASWVPEEPAEGEEPEAYDGSLGYEIAIPAEAHRRKNGDFGFHVFHQVDGRYITNTWAALGTGADYDGEAGTVILSSSDPYPGKILFVG